MAKFCEVCKRAYPDDLKYCPRCVGAVEDSGIDLGASHGESPSSISGVSAVDGLEVVEEPAPAGTSEDSAVDLGESPVLAEEAASGEPAPHAGAESRGEAEGGEDVVEELTEEAPPEPTAPAAPKTMLAAAGQSSPEEAASQEAPSPKATMLAAHQAKVTALAAAQAKATMLATGQAKTTALAAGQAKQTALASGQEMVQDLLGEAPPGGEGGVHLGESVEEVAEHGTGDEAGGAGVNLAEAGVEAETPGEPAIVEHVGESGIDLGGAVVVEDVTGEPLPGESPSGRDLIAEAVESGVDLPGPDVEEGDEAGEVVALGASTPSSGPSSSAVDLGSSAEVDLPPVSGTLGEEVPLEQVAVSSEAVDLEGLEPPPGGSGLSGPEVSASSVDLGSEPDVGAEEAGVSVSEEVAESGIDLGELPESEEAAVSEEAVVDEEAGELVGAGVGADEEEPAMRDLPSRPEPAPAPRGRKGAWFGGTFLGLLLGCGTLLGLWLFGIEPPKEWRESLGLAAKEAPKGNKPGGPVGPTGPGPGTTGPAVAESRTDLLRRGEFEKAAQAGGGDQPAELAERGEARWLAYLARQRQAKAPVNPTDKAVTDAKADLEKAAAANNANALFWLGHLQEQTGQVKEAKATYTAGAEKFKDIPAQKRLFEAALHRVEAMGGEGPPAGGAWLPPEWRNDPVALMALALFALQPPPGPEQPGDDSEAGFDFWRAMNQARQQNYAAAIDALDKARAEHDVQRFSRLRKAQNPRSDPTEDIFLKSCDELKAYWQMEEKLKKSGYLDLAAKKDPVKAVDDVLKQAVAGGDSAKVLGSLADKLAKDKIIDKPEDLDKGVDQLLSDRKDAMTKIADLDKKLKASTEEAADLMDKLKTSKAEAAALDKKVKESAERETKLKADLASEQAVVQGIADSLKAATFLEPKATREDVPAGLKEALRIAQMKDPMGYIRKLEGQVARDEAELKERWRPAQMLAFWLPLMEQGRERKGLEADALKDVGRVLKDPEAKPADRARAEVIRGLALRNELNFAGAREALEKAQEGLKGDRNVWVVRAEEALQEVSDPAGWFASRAAALHDRGKSSEALALLAKATEGLPAKDQPALLAQRSLIELDVARAAARGPISPRDPTLAAARKDAEEAAKAGLAEGFYAAGRVAEELGRWDAAADSYRKALAAHPELDAAGSRYRIALARVLVAPRESRPLGVPPAPLVPPPPPEPKAEPDKVGQLDPLPDAARRAEALRFAALLAVLSLQPPGMPAPAPGQEEAEKLADEVLKAPAGRVPFDVRAQALALKGRWTLGLLTYVEGLRAFLPPNYEAGLLDLVRNHPRLKRPDTLVVPNPLDAERHYAAGLNFYYERDYPAAEKSFASAVENDSQDARYFYFLGLARLAQNKREAYEDFDQGAALESQNKPPSPVVSASLERIQGPVRRIVNDARTRVR